MKVALILLIGLMLPIICSMLPISCSSDNGKTTIIKDRDDSDDDDDDDDSSDDDVDDDASDDDASDDDAGDDDTGDDDDDVSGGLTWQDPPSSGYIISVWEAIEHCETLSIDDHNDWRLPTINELRSLIRGCDATELGGSCGVTDACTGYEDCWNDACDGCGYLEGPGSDGAYWPDGMTGDIGWYWSSSPVADSAEGSAWTVDFGYGYVFYSYHNVITARCVR